MSVIEVEHLRKVFRVNRKQPVKIVGYIGVNGTGKSTTIKMLTGVFVAGGFDAL